MKPFFAWVKKIANWIVDTVQEFVADIRRSKQESYQEIEKLNQQLQSEQAVAKEEDSNKEPKRFIWRFWLIGMVVVIAGYLLFRSLEFIYLIIAGFIIAMAMESLVKFFQKWLSRGFAIGVAYFILIIFVLSGLIIVVPFVMQQIADIVGSLVSDIIAFQQTLQTEGLEATILSSNLPAPVKSSLAEMMAENDWLMGLQTALLNNMTQLVSMGSSYIQNAGNVAVNIVSAFFSAIIKVMLVFILAIFFTVEKKKVINFLAHVSGHVTYTELKLMKLYRKLGFWLEGQLVLCITIGIMVWIGLNVIAWVGVDLPNKFTLALIAGLTEFIPYLGPFMGMFPAILLGIAGFGWKGLIVVILLYWVIQQSENNVLVPLVMYHALGVSPLVIFICMIVGGSIFGFLGVVLAVPIAVILSILFEDFVASSGDEVDN